MPLGWEGLLAGKDCGVEIDTSRSSGILVGASHRHMYRAEALGMLDHYSVCFVQCRVSTACSVRYVLDIP